MRPFSFRFAARGLLALAAWAPSVIVQPAAAQQAVSSASRNLVRETMNVGKAQV